MRVIAGKARGIKLTAPKGFDVRPAQDRVKESIFNILADVVDEMILDVFAGSGSLGIEALSRGAKSAVFIEASKPCAKSISENLERCHLDDRARILTIDFKRALKMIGKKDDSFGIIFVDPPYFKDLIPEALKLLAVYDIASKDTLVLAEHHIREELEIPPEWTLTDRREYGQTVVSFMRLSSD